MSDAKMDLWPMGPLGGHYNACHAPALSLCPPTILPLDVCREAQQLSASANQATLEPGVNAVPLVFTGTPW